MSTYADAIEQLVRAENTHDKKFVELFRLVCRDMRSQLSTSEFLVLFFIFDRTISYGKSIETITHDHFLSGVWSGEICLHPPITLSRSSLKRALHRLEALKMIQIRRGSGRERGAYGISELWSRGSTMNPQRVHHEPPEGPPHARSSKHGNSNTGYITGCADAQVLTQVGTDAMSIDAMEAIRKSVAAATDKSQARREVKKKKTNATAYQVIWEDAFRNHFPDDQLFEWRVYEIAAFKKALTRGVDLDKVRPFIEYTVEHFVGILNDRFRWMKSKPTAPSIGFVTKHIDVFYAAYQDGDDPNRKLRRRIVDKAPDNVIPEAKRIAELEARIKELEHGVHDTKTPTRSNTATAKAAARATLDRASTRDEELGGWDDAGTTKDGVVPNSRRRITVRRR